MASLTDSLVSSSARKLTLRVRPDLTAERHRYQGQTYWVVKEPLGLNYFRFQEEEYAMLRMLDGESSLDDIKERFEEEFPPQKITVEELSQFVGMLHRSGLVIADVPGQGRQLKKRREERERRQFWATMSNVLAIRFKGFDPDRLLTWMYPKLRWMFTRAAVVCCCVLALSALTLVLVQFEAFRSKLPAFHDFFAAQNWIWLGVALVVTKIIHEFGHGLSCKHFGGECHEMGVLVLVLTPCLYCNVSDSWMLPSKWHRAAIGAAGMYIEVVIASIATFVWWFSQPGLLNQLALSTMFVSSVSTIMFNANPLLRYDGYYILCDLAEIPNLRQKSSTILHRKLGAWCLGLEEPEDPFLPQRNQVFFAIYAIAATVYSWVVAISILWFLHQVFGPELKVLGQIIALVALFGLVVLPLWKLFKFFKVPGRIDKVKKPRMYATLAIVGAIVLAIALVPLPYHVYCTLEVQPRGAQPVYVSVPGTLSEIKVRAGDEVQAKRPLAQLTDVDLELAIADLTGQRNEYRAQLDSLRRQRINDHRAGLEIAQVHESLATVEEQLNQKERDLASLQLLAPIAGTIIPPPAIRLQPDPDGRLPSWSGTPMNEKNLGATLEKRVLFCQVGDPRRMEAILVVDQSDIDFVQEQQHVEIKLDELPGDTFESQIARVAQAELKATPIALSSKAGGAVVTETDTAGNERPTSTSYQASVPLDNPDGLLLPGLTGQAKVHVGYRTLGFRLWRYLTQTFNFRL